MPTFIKLQNKLRRITV